nr:3'-5' exonuclease [Acidovorax sp. Leaf78]
MTAPTPPRRAVAHGQTQTPTPTTADTADTAPHGRAHPSHHQAIPGKEQIALLDAFERLGMDSITLVRTPEQADRARDALCKATAWGFDTESKPTFVQGEASDGPHIVQLSTLDHAWVFQLQDAGCRARVAELLALRAVTKAGFGLGDDTKRIKAKLGVEPADVLELNTVFRQRGYRKDMGVKAAVAVLFNRRFLKSKKAATSNWANDRLTEAQVLYAANDAWAALRVFHALQVPAAPAA